MSALALSFDEVISDERLLGRFFAGESWARWRAVGKAIFAEPMTDAEIELLREVADRGAPSRPVSEAVAIVGRGGGKDAFASAIAVKIAISFDPCGRLRPGEKAVVMILAVDRAQAAIAFNYIRASFEESPALAAMIVDVGEDFVELSNKVVIEVHTNSYRSVRGRSVLCCVMDECSFWRDENSSNPDTEVYAALRPALARVSGSLLVLITSAHKRAGMAYERWKSRYGKDGDVLCIRGTTTQFNPLFPAEVIASDLARDPVVYASEYLSQFRDDLNSYLDRQIVEAAVDSGVLVRPPRKGIVYHAFCDPSGGRGDSFTCAIAHGEDGLVLADLVFERRAPFDPGVVVGEIAGILKPYRCRTATGDRYSANWVVDAFRRVGIRYETSELDRSAIYANALPIFTTSRARLVENAKLVSQLAGLERRTFANGRERIDHGVGGHDDLSNSCCGALVLADSAKGPIVPGPGAMAWAKNQSPDLERSYSWQTLNNPAVPRW